MCWEAVITLVLPREHRDEWNFMEGLVIVMNEITSKRAHPVWSPLTFPHQAD